MIGTLAPPPQQFTNAATLATGQYKEAGLMLFRNGLLLTEGLDFTRAGSLVTFVVPPGAGDIVTARVFARGKQLGGTTPERYISPWSLSLAGAYDGTGTNYQIQFGPSIVGDCDGVNNLFTWGVNMPRVKIYRNGVLQTFGVDVYAGPTAMVFLAGAIPQPGDIITMMGFSS